MCLCTQGWKPELREKGDGVRERERERERERARATCVFVPRAGSRSSERRVTG